MTTTGKGASPIFNYLIYAGAIVVIGLGLIGFSQSASNLAAINEIRSTQRLIVLDKVVQSINESQALLKKVRALPNNDRALDHAAGAAATAELALDTWAKGDLDKAMEDTFRVQKHIGITQNYLDCGQEECEEKK